MYPRFTQHIKPYFLYINVAIFAKSLIVHLGLVVSKRIFHVFCSQKLEGFYVSFNVQNYRDFLYVLGFMGRKLEQNI